MDKKKKKDDAVEALKAEREEYLNGWKRALADFDNLQKEAAERTHSRVQAETDRLVHELLTIADMYGQALTHVPNTVEQEPWMQGFKHIGRQLDDLLQSLGVEQVSTDGEFNPEMHEAVETEKHDDKPDNHIVSVITKGYKRNDKLIRPSKVIVNKRS